MKIAGIVANSGSHALCWGIVRLVFVVFVIVVIVVVVVVSFLSLLHLEEPVRAHGISSLALA